jgi:hypothetical protein
MKETFKVGDYSVTVEQDTDAQSPREDGDTGLFLVAKHRDFWVPAPGMKTIPEYRNEIVDTYKKTHHIFNLEAYIHSGVRLALSGEGNFPDRQWDVSQLGMVFASKKEWRLTKSARKAALALIETWNHYLSGDVWYIRILGDKNEELESCGGFIGSFDEAKKEATDMAKSWSKRA